MARDVEEQGEEEREKDTKGTALSNNLDTAITADARVSQDCNNSLCNIGNTVHSEMIREQVREGVREKKSE